MAFIIAFLILATVTVSPADPGDYDPTTGEPKCMNCHTRDRRYSIDYTREESCAECHGPGISGKYIAIDGRYRAGDAHGEPFDKALITEEQTILADAKDLKRGAASANKKKAQALEGMAFVEPGAFTMGSNDWWPKSQPEHMPALKAFYIDKFEVTNRRYKTYVDSTGAPAPRHWPGGQVQPEKLDHPVVFVSWHDADKFCRYEGKRLPTEAEWEKAARGTDKRAFPWGDKFSKEKGNTPQYGKNDTMPVGSFESGKSPYGAYDMAGNVFEWVADWFLPYPGNKHPDENYGERYKVVRGGSWYDCTYYKCGISAPAYNRIFFSPYTKNNNFGFRCAKDG